MLYAREVPINDLLHVIGEISYQNIPTCLCGISLENVYK